MGEAQSTHRFPQES